MEPGSRQPSWRIRRRPPLVGAVLAVGPLLLAAGQLVAGRGASASQASTTRPPNPPALNKAIRSLQGEERATFTATYDVTGSSGKKLAFTVLHRGTDVRIDLAAGAVVLGLGGKTYWCVPVAQHVMCQKESTLATIPFVTLLTPQQALSELELYQKHTVAGVTLSTSQRTIAGQHAVCIHSSTKSGSATYCVTSDVLAYAGSGGSAIELTHFAASAPASSFALPKGATITSGLP